jgi:uncharacterized SAM-binding protein YcdF (DUF218 family)
MQEIDTYAQKIWDYMLMHQKPEVSDAIFVLGSNDIRVAERAADLYLEGLAPLVVFSGGNGKGSLFDRPEAEVFSDVALARGVPKQNVILETRATNTGDNVFFTKELLTEKGIQCSSFILVQKPYMERRTYATFRKQWPEARCTVTSPQISYEEYEREPDSKKRFLDCMVGDLQRIKEYPAKGFQIPQEIPEDVWNAYEKLVELGYTKYVMST